jgi:hypothetical protein
METKPYNLQSPEQIAKDYGGNKQKIAEAMQMGIIDPTAGTLAGMFIDRMRQAAQTEAAPQQTVAQQVFAPPQMPMGLGATPQAAAMAAPAPEMPAMGMAGGGLTTLPIPDDMFDEPDEGGYAGGGLVAFADGGDVLGPWFEEVAVGAVPGIGVTSRKRSAADNKRVDGVENSYHLTDNARDFVPPEGMGMGALHKKLKSLFGSGYDVINEGDHIHVEPGSRGSAKRELASAAQGPGKTLYGFPTDLRGNIEMLTGMAPPEAEEQLAYREDLKKRLSPESRAEDKKTAFYEGLAKFAERLGSSKSPTFLGGLAESVGAGASDLATSLRAAEEDAREMQREYVGLANASRKEKMELMRMGVDVTGNMARLAEGIEARKVEVELKREQLALAREELNANIEAAKAKGLDVDQMVFAMIASNDPAKKAVATEYLNLRYGGSDGRKGKTNTLEERVEAGKGGGKEGGSGFKYLGTE